jgi:hypothetical protein
VGGDVERFVDRAREVVHVANEIVVLGAGARDADRVGFLESIRADEVSGHLAGEDDHRDGIHQRVGQRRHHVGGAGAGCGERNAALAGGAGIAFGHVSGALLVPDEDVAHLLLRIDGVIDRKDGAARIAEHRVDALIGERAKDDLGAGQLLVARLRRLRFHLAVSVHLAARQSFSGLGKRKRATRALGCASRRSARCELPGRRRANYEYERHAAPDMGFLPKTLWKRPIPFHRAQRQSGPEG